MQPTPDAHHPHPAGGACGASEPPGVHAQLVELAVDEEDGRRHLMEHLRTAPAHHPGPRFKIAEALVGRRRSVYGSQAVFGSRGTPTVLVLAATHTPNPPPAHTTPPRAPPPPPPAAPPPTPAGCSFS